MFVFCMAVVFALCIQLMGMVPAFAILVIATAAFVRRVGWRRAIFPFTAHRYSYR
jgi:hypothetical protein